MNLSPRSNVAGRSSRSSRTCYPPDLARKLRRSQLPRQVLRERCPALPDLITSTPDRLPAVPDRDHATKGVMVSALCPAAHAAVTPNAPLTRVSPKGMLPHISCIAAPLILESNVISDANSAPPRKPWQAVRERAGILLR